MPNIEVKDNFKGLDNFKMNLRTSKVVKIGIFGNKNARDDSMTNVKVGMKHEFGSFSEGIPRRSFLKDPMQIKRKELLNKTGKVIDKKITDNKGSDEILETIGVIGETIVQQAFETSGFGTWEPLSSGTINKKGSSSILIDTGQLRRAITSKVDTL